MTEKTIYQDLKEKIILLEHKPGSVLREKEIMESFGVSRTPVREALMRLEMDGLVRIIPHVGTFVADVSFQQLKDVFEVRTYLVGLAGALAAARMTSKELEEVRRLVDSLRGERDPVKLMKVDGEIHRLINRSTKNEVLINILNKLHDQAVRIWTFSGDEAGYWSDLVEEFDRIVEALERRDEKKVSDLLEKHTKSFVETIRRQLMV